MKVGLVDVDGHNFPNLVMMKLSSFYKSLGVETKLISHSEIDDYDTVFASKVFTWTEDTMAGVGDTNLKGGNVFKGGTGYKMYNNLPDEIEHIVPDYSLYNLDYSMGFLTRGCIRKCPWCFVPKKEGAIKAHADIEEFARHNEVVLLDNNVLASDHGLRQIEKIGKLGLKIDFNQGLDARLIDDSVARLLSSVKWRNPIRLACDMSEMMPVIQKAVTNLRWHNVTPTTYSAYVLVTEDIDDALERVRFLKGIKVDPFAQPYRNENGDEPSDLQKDLARWINHKATFKKVQWSDYKKRSA